LKISAIAITLNEAEAIDSYLNSLSFADEIIIVDSFSTDNTVALASAHPKVMVYKREFDNFSAQKNFALSKTSNDWVVFFDLDEEITTALSEEIMDTLKSPKAAAYAIKRDFFFMSRKIKYSGMQNDWVIRVFNKKHCRYNDRLVHENLEIEGETQKFKNKLPHHTYKTFDAYTQKLHHYSALQAKMLYEDKKWPNWYHFLFRPWYRFWHQYLIRLGVLDGKEGFILAYTSAFATFKRYVNLWMLYRKID